jgi:hypothetical protein
VTDIVEFLRARLEEDVRSAEATRKAGDMLEGMTGVRPEMPGYDFERMLREAEAKRRIMELAEIDDIGTYGSNGGAILQWLAAVYSDHPDYRQEWKP